jgi:hypothetical protein
MDTTGSHRNKAPEPILHTNTGNETNVFDMISIAVPWFRISSVAIYYICIEVNNDDSGGLPGMVKERELQVCFSFNR